MPTPRSSSIIAGLLTKFRAIDPAGDAQYNYKVNSAGERPEEFDPGSFEGAGGITQVFLQVGKVNFSEEAHEGLHHDVELLVLSCQQSDPDRSTTADERGEIARKLGADILRAALNGDWSMNGLINDNLEPVEMRIGTLNGVVLASVFFIARYTTDKDYS